ncbi:hypothetical protein PNEG_01120 [Pneumocystis murina B123]|uniref:Uncharacterized protein n=1 Tax=Pneumocystis murina (strain B123) TaxID=1069680 RepID=M7P980_PNEMU|nr:hypothetical protein PNEG_01120 [Pneumocystis murina B123]EMR10405.1 hypothetical protein PNEG_01120 [Pneumocystis murina B123]
MANLDNLVRHSGKMEISRTNTCMSKQYSIIFQLHLFSLLLSVFIAFFINNLSITFFINVINKKINKLFTMTFSSTGKIPCYDSFQTYSFSRI